MNAAKPKGTKPAGTTPTGSAEPGAGVHDLADLVARNEIIVVAGAGGVGKTTVSAALGLAAAERVEGDTLVLTIDPARRLATALGVDIDGNDPVQVRGGLHAAMLDPGPAWDDLVAAVTTAEAAERVHANPVYRRIADTFVHGNDYAALGWLADAIDDDRWGLIIVDTPPSQNALDFFDAPARVESFFTSPLLGWLTGTGGGSVVGTAASKTFATFADRLLGAEFFGDIVEFFQLMQPVVPGMVDRTAAVADRLAADSSAFVAVTAATNEVLDRMQTLSAELGERELRFDGVVVNGVEPDVFADAKVIDVAQRITGQSSTSSPFNATHTALLAPGADYVAERATVARAQRALIDDIPAQRVVTVPRLLDAPTTVDALEELGRTLLGE